MKPACSSCTTQSIGNGSPMKFSSAHVPSRGGAMHEDPFHDTSVHLSVWD